MCKDEDEAEEGFNTMSCGVCNVTTEVKIRSMLVVEHIYSLLI